MSDHVPSLEADPSSILSTHTTHNDTHGYSPSVSTHAPELPDELEEKHPEGCTASLSTPLLGAVHSDASVGAHAIDGATQELSRRREVDAGVRLLGEGLRRRQVDLALPENDEELSAESLESTLPPPYAEYL